MTIKKTKVVLIEVRDKALEDAAKVCEVCEGHSQCIPIAVKIAAERIRNLKSSFQSPSQKDEKRMIKCTDQGLVEVIARIIYKDQYDDSPDGGYYNGEKLMTNWMIFIPKAKRYLRDLMSAGYVVVPKSTQKR